MMEVVTAIVLLLRPNPVSAPKGGACAAPQGHSSVSTASRADVSWGWGPAHTIANFARGHLDCVAEASALACHGPSSES